MQGNVTESNSSSLLKTGTLTTRTDEHLEKSFTSVMTPVETETPNQENEDQTGLGQNTCVKENTNEFAMVTETGQVTIPTLELPDDDDELLDESLSTEGHSKTTTFNEDDDNHPVEVVASRESESLTIGTVTNIVTNCNDKPNQPMLPEFPSKKIGNETLSRKFNPKWYKLYPWLDYESHKDRCVCFSCRKFENDPSFVFDNWKKPEKLQKHANSEKHITSMIKWALFKASQLRNTSVLHQLSNAHKEHVESNRKYLKIIIECLVHNLQQNIPLRGHEECRNNIWEVSDINRGNFLELFTFAARIFLG